MQNLYSKVISNVKKLVLPALVASVLGACTSNFEGQNPIVVAPNKTTTKPYKAPKFQSKQVPAPSNISEPAVTDFKTQFVVPERTAALLLPLSGQHSGLGQRMLNAATMAQQDMGHRGFKLLPIDTKSTQTDAIAAAQQAVSANADIILGPIFANHVQAVAKVAGNIPVISFSNNPDVTSSNVYALGYQQQEALLRVLNYAQKEGFKRYFIMVPKGRITESVTQAVEKFASEKFASILPYTPFEPSVNGMNKVVKDLADATALPEDTDSYSVNREKTAVLAVVPPSQLESLVSLLQYHDIDTTRVQLLGNLGWKVRYAMLTPELNGAWFAAPADEARQDFDKRYAAAFKEMPKALESLAYDAVAMAAVLSKDDKTPYSPLRLQNRNGFQGVDGLFYLRPSGKVDRKFAVFEVTQSGFRQIGKAR